MEDKLKKSKRDYEINTLRAVAMILVVLLHANAVNITRIFNNKVQLVPVSLVSIIVVFISVVTRIGVPIFVMISGRYLLKSLENEEMKLGNFYKRRIARLLLPLAFGIVIYGVIYQVSCQLGFFDKTMVDYLKNIICGFADANDFTVVLWYMYMLLGLYMMAPILYKLMKNIGKRKRIIIGIFLCIFGMIFELAKNLSGINLWTFWWLEFVGLFLMGYILKEVKLEKKRFLLFFTAMLVEILSAVGSYVLLSQGNYLGKIFHLGVIGNTQITAIIIYLFFNSFKGSNGILSKLSKYSLGIYLIHPIIIAILQVVISMDSFNLIGENPLLIISANLVISYGLSMGIVMLLYKNKYLRRFVS